nr:hypothetical protein [Cressdnaviricota sp.]
MAIQSEMHYALVTTRGAADKHRIVDRPSVRRIDSQDTVPDTEEGNPPNASTHGNDAHAKFAEYDVLHYQERSCDDAADVREFHEQLTNEQYCKAFLNFAL